MAVGNFKVYLSKRSDLNANIREWIFEGISEGFIINEGAIILTFFPSKKINRDKALGHIVGQKISSDESNTIKTTMRYDNIKLNDYEMTCRTDFSVFKE